AGVTLLTACSNPLENLTGELAEEGVERIVEEAAGDDAEFDINLDGEASLPSSWPDSVPAPPGTLVASFADSESGNATFEADSEDEVLAFVDQLKANGYEVDQELSSGLDAVALDNGEIWVSVGWVPDDDGKVFGTVTYVPSAEAQ
ncbi:hypothetical protein, partial [uncultured Demequina sp.]|uniref:hypothetical protein n=1 Tax=uncultured Demequina sp. TaxID=693499 RepID=UPI0025D39CBC